MTDLYDVKKSLWKDAAIGGGIIGLAMFVITLLQVTLQTPSMGTVLSLVEFLTLAYLIYYYARKRGAKYGELGFSYSQSMGYIFAMMLFAGFVAGLGSFLLVRFIAPEYYEQAYQTMLDNNPFYDPDAENAAAMERLVQMFQTNPIVNVIGGIFVYLIYGGFIGLLASAFTKRKPDIFADQQ